MTQVNFIRHGKRDRHIDDPSLTSEGRAEAALLGAKLDSTCTSIFTSPLARTRETAGVLAEIMDLKVVVDPRLRERMNWGDVENQSFDAFAADWDRCSHDRNFRPLVGDSSIEAGRRVEAFVLDCHVKSYGSVVAVTHGGVLADFLLNVFSPEELDRTRPEFGARPYSGDVIPECSLTSVGYDGERYKLHAIGSVLL